MVIWHIPGLLSLQSLVRRRSWVCRLRLNPHGTILSLEVFLKERLHAQPVLKGSKYMLLSSAPAR